MSFSDNYFSRYNNKPKIFEDSPSANLEAIIVIPCYNDFMIFDTLDSVEKSIYNSNNTEIIVVVNSGENTTFDIVEKNKEIFQKLVSLKEACRYNFKLLPVLFDNIPRKVAGVGFARKVGMDEAVRRFSEINKPYGIIISLDADCIVDNDYLKLIIQSFKNNKDCGGYVFQFQHNFDTNIYSSEIIQACKLYEIYLRYFKLSLDITGFPNSFYTIGSCFAVNAISYIKVGGMSCRQGGEDFYFLHKLALMTKIGEINRPIVFPSPRISDRVPFGTGPAVRDIINTKIYKVYNFELFFLLKTFFGCFEDFANNDELNIHKVPIEIIDYIGEAKLVESILDCKKHSSQSHNFIKRLFSKYDAFFIIKFLNSFNEKEQYQPIIALEAAKLLLEFCKSVSRNESVDCVYDAIFSLDLNRSSTRIRK